MGYKSQHSPRGFYTEPKLNPRTNNKLLIIAVGCANSVENSVFKKNVFLAVLHLHLLKTKDSILG